VAYLHKNNIISNFLLESRESKSYIFMKKNFLNPLIALDKFTRFAVRLVFFLQKTGLLVTNYLQ